MQSNKDCQSSSVEFKLCVLLRKRKRWLTWRLANARHSSDRKYVQAKYTAKSYWSRMPKRVDWRHPWYQLLSTTGYENLLKWLIFEKVKDKVWFEHLCTYHGSLKRKRIEGYASRSLSSNALQLMLIALLSSVDMSIKNWPLTGWENYMFFGLESTSSAIATGKSTKTDSFKELTVFVVIGQWCRRQWQQNENHQHGVMTNAETRRDSSHTQLLTMCTCATATKHSIVEGIQETGCSICGKERASGASP